MVEERGEPLLTSFPLRLSVCGPAPVTRSPDSASGTCFAGPHFPWSPPLAPPTPLRLAPLQIAPHRAVPLCSPVSQLLWQGPTSRVRASPATTPRLPGADRPSHAALTARHETSQLPVRSFCT